MPFYAYAPDPVPTPAVIAEDQPDRVPDGMIIPGIDFVEGRPDGWVDIQPGWGQQPSAPIAYQWGGPNAEFDVRITEAPVYVERSDHPNRPAPSNHGGRK